MKVRKIVYLALFTAVAIVLSIVESFIPTGTFGLKIGLANIITLIVLYMYSYKEALMVLLLRIFLTGLLYSGITSVSFLMSLSGGILAFTGMAVFYRLNKNRIYLLSITGSILHLAGEMIILIFYLKLDGWYLYIPLLLILSVITGLVTGLAAKLSLKPLKVLIPRINIMEVIIPVILIALLSVSEIFIYNAKYKSYSDEVVLIKSDDKEILEIDLNNPSTYKYYSDDFLSLEIKDDSYYYHINLYNNDDKSYHEAVIVVENKRVKVEEITCKNGVCIHTGWISKSYERIICLPNKMVISIVNYNDSDIDIIQ